METEAPSSEDEPEENYNQVSWWRKDQIQTNLWS
jgi:hypothetical protein